MGQIHPWWDSNDISHLYRSFLNEVNWVLQGPSLATCIFNCSESCSSEWSFPSLRKNHFSVWETQAKPLTCFCRVKFTLFKLKAWLKCAQHPAELQRNSSLAALKCSQLLMELCICPQAQCRSHWSPADLCPCRGQCPAGAPAGGLWAKQWLQHGAVSGCSLCPLSDLAFPGSLSCPNVSAPSSSHLPLCCSLGLPVTPDENVVNH